MKYHFSTHKLKKVGVKILRKRYWVSSIWLNTSMVLINSQVKLGGSEVDGDEVENDKLNDSYTNTFRQCKFYTWVKDFRARMFVG